MRGHVKKEVRVTRGPFFQIDSAWYIDVMFNFRSALTIDVHEIALWLAAIPASQVLVARRMTATEIRKLLTFRMSCDHEVAAFTLPSDEARWRVPRKK